MARKAMKGPKDPFQDLTEDFKDAVAQSSREEIEKRISDVALYDVELRKQKKEDQDLKEKAEAYKEASAIYREGLKSNRIKIEYCKRVLDDKGGPTTARDFSADPTGTLGSKLQSALKS